MVRRLYKKGLVVGIIVLFLGLAFIPSFNAVSISKEISNESDSMLEDEDWLATMTIDIGYEISNDSITYLDKTFYPDKNYYVELFIYYDIPSSDTKKVYIEYWIDAQFVPFGRQPTQEEHFLWAQNSTFVNSSPEDIYVKEYTRIEPSLGYYFVLNLHLFAFIDVYELYGDYWVKVDEDVCLKNIFVRGFLSKTRTRTLDYPFLERFPLLNLIFQRLTIR